MGKWFNMHRTASLLTSIASFLTFAIALANVAFAQLDKAAQSDEAVTQLKPEAAVWNKEYSNYVVGTIVVDELENHTRTLADDTMQGREAGSAGGRAAGNYLIGWMSKNHLKPAGDQGTFIQSFGNGYRNLLGYVEGSDPNLKDEFILVAAHYDHVGLGNASNSNGPLGQIHNGADDNASGTSAVMEMIEAMDSIEAKPRRSILFVFWDGEEKGLLGSKHWVSNPTLPLSQVKLMLNLDMVGRLRQSGLEIYGAQTAPGLRRIVSHANEDQVPLAFNWDLKEDSDHYPFAMKNVPIVMFHTGLHEQYHRPSDDPETINFTGMQDVARTALRTALLAANADANLQFRVRAKQESEATRRQNEQPEGPRPGRLGVTVDRDSVNGVLLTQVQQNGPAQLGGLQGNDFLLKINETQLNGSEDLIRTLVGAPQTITVTFVRDGETLEREVNLRGQPMRIGLTWKPDVSDPSLLIVTEVIRGSAAEVGGLAVGDRIYQFNGVPCEGSDDLLKNFAENSGEVELLVERAGRLRYLLMDIGPIE